MVQSSIEDFLADGFIEEDYIEDFSPPGPSPEVRHGSGNVITWPKNKRAVSAIPQQPSDAQEVQKGMDLLHKLSHPHEPEQPATEIEFSPILLPQPVRPGATLREEMPKAVTAYRRAWFHLRKSLPQIVGTKKVDLPGFESAVNEIISSLERNRDALFCLTKLLSSKGYVYTHSVNVCIYMGAYVLNSGMSHQEALKAGIGGLLHDIGMSLLPHSLLRAPGGLSPTEKVLVKRHPALAHEILKESPGISGEALNAALEHHERYDGSGYPNGLSGDDISFIGHLSSIASSFDAISSDREFKRSLQPHYALGEMFKQRNKQFHPDMLDTFIRMIGIFPVGTVVRLEDGYLGVVSAISPDNLTRPIVTLVRDPKGKPMVHLECDMAREKIAGISGCLNPTDVDIPVHQILGIRL